MSEEWPLLPWWLVSKVEYATWSLCAMFDFLPMFSKTLTFRHYCSNEKPIIRMMSMALRALMGLTLTKVARLDFRQAGRH